MEGLAHWDGIKWLNVLRYAIMLADYAIVNVCTDVAFVAMCYRRQSARCDHAFVVRLRSSCHGTQHRVDMVI
jgi:hypothetical protein